MKKLLWALLALLAVAVGFMGQQVTTYLNQPESTEQQQLRLEKTLWKVEKQFRLDGYVFQMNVARQVDMDKVCPGAWGCSQIETDQIYLLDIRDYPLAMPQRERIPFQNKVLQHELMHFVFSGLEMPPDVQDKFIHTLQPSLIQP